MGTGEQVESVLMEHGDRNTICLSTQVGCAVDCGFCATAKMGFIKNLTVGEIVDQFIQLRQISNKKITLVRFSCFRMRICIFLLRAYANEW